MPTRHCLCLLVFALLLPCCASAQNIQKDPQNRFTIEVPIGWHIVFKDDEMKLTMGDSYITVLQVPPQGNAFKNLQLAIGQAQGLLDAAQPLERGETTLAGEHAVFANFVGIDDRSVDMYVRFVATDSGWVFYAGSPKSGFSSLRSTLMKMEQSLKLTKTVAPPPSAPATAAPSPK